MNWRLGLVLVVGCGDVSATKKPDAAVTVDMSQQQADAAVDAPPPPCDVTQPFGTPVPVGGVNSNSLEMWGWLSPDRLTIYFSSTATGSTDRNIYTATRASVTSPFSGVMLVAGGVNSGSIEDRAVVTPDGLTMFYETNAGGDYDIYVSTRSSTVASWGTGTLVGVINDATATDWNAFITADGLTMYFGSDRGGNLDLYTTTRASATMSFGAPTALLALNSPQNDFAPVLSADGLEMFWASYRAGGGNNDIWRATRTTTNDGFGTPALVTELNVGGADEFPNWLSPDRCTLLYTSDKSGGMGSWDLYIATRPQ